jgi:alkylhydroperoxidase family enzyme
VLGDELVKAVLDDYTRAPIDERLRATLGLLKKVSLAPSEVTAADVRPALAAGASRVAVEQALYVAFAFNVFVRMADALDFKLQTPAETAVGVKILLKRGYR